MAMCALLRFWLERLFWNLEDGMTPKEAVDKVADDYGLYKEGRTYEYLLKRAYEHRERS